MHTLMAVFILVGLLVSLGCWVVITIWLVRTLWQTLRRPVAVVPSPGQRPLPA